ncbi:hypothetical protein IQ07DRAFT_340855 [Pyrenochaeta sp. DS3sAY3a]|nr:hypothetical protein IQ07DRAFT_340855 [Pyrenochaeta sp. DS3sAY3a]
MLDATALFYQASACGLSNYSTEAILPEANEAIDEEDEIFCCSFQWTDVKSCFIRQGNARVNNITQQVSKSWMETVWMLVNVLLFLTSVQTISTTTEFNTNNEPTYRTASVQVPSLSTKESKPECGWESEMESGTAWKEVEGAYKVNSWREGRFLHSQISREYELTYQVRGKPQICSKICTRLLVEEIPESKGRRK